jgi:hypothetical protein
MKLHRSRPGFFALACLALAIVEMCSAAEATEPPRVKTLTPPAKMLFIGSDEKSARAADEKLKKHFESIGFIVTLAGQSEPAAQQLNGQDLVFISASTRSEKMPHAQAEILKHTKVPMVNCSSAMLGRLSMTGLRAGIDWGMAATERDGAIAVFNQTHPMQAEFPNGSLRPFNGAVRELNWGKPGVGAIKIAMVPGKTDQMLVFGYDRNAIMDYQFAAPARRIMACLPEGTFDQLTDHGRHMLNNALTWALSRKPLAR